MEDSMTDPDLDPDLETQKPETAGSGKPTAEVVATLVASHREFLAFVQRRVGGDRALAEDIVQEALVRSVERAGEIRESAVGWFYRMLRNAIIDRSRRAAVARQRLDALAAELDSALDRELENVVCRCVGELASTLKPEYADALRKIDVDGMAVKDYAADAGITASNAGVRVFRARAALREQVTRACGTCATHGCVDCTCQARATPSGA
jgi:RNA polymerase sigma-70 factor (ECF subfamily)